MMAHISHVSILTIIVAQCDIMLYNKYIGNNGDVIADLPPMSYTLMVEAATDDDPPQSASDVVGPVTLTGGSAQCKYNTHSYTDTVNFL